MQVNDQVQLTRVAEGDEESLGRAGVVTAVAGRDEDQLVTVLLDETPTHEAGEVEVPVADLTFLAR